MLGKIHASKNEWGEVLKCAEEALACDAQHIEAKNLKTLALRNLGQQDAAQAEMRQTLAEDPDNAWTHANLGWSLLEKNDTKQAMHHFREALRIDPELDWARAGVVETLKSRNVIYRLFFRYFLMMGRLTKSGQWKVVLGLWLFYMVLRKVAESVPALAPWVMPLLAIYILFCIGSWLAGPLADLALRLHPFGKLALSRSQRTASNWIGGFLLAAVLCAVAAFALDSGVLLLAAVYFAFMLLPLGAMFMAPWPQPRKALIGYAVVVGLMGVAFVVRAALPEGAIAPALEGPLAMLGSNFPLAAVLSLIAGNVLASFGWTR